MHVFEINVPLDSGWRAVRVSTPDWSSPLVSVEMEHEQNSDVERVVLDVSKRMMFGALPELHTATTVEALMPKIADRLRTERLQEMNDAESVRKVMNG